MNPAPAPLRIRPMTPGDIRRAAEIANALPHAPRWPAAAYLDALGPGNLPRRIALVAEDLETGIVLGFAVASLLPPQAELETIAVATAAQRRGIARRLFAALTAELSQAEVTEVMLEVRPSNLPALEFYRFLGLRESGRRPRYYVDPEEDAVLMSLALA